MDTFNERAICEEKPIIMLVSVLDEEILKCSVNLNEHKPDYSQNRFHGGINGMGSEF
jgi:hypothetical protein